MFFSRKKEIFQNFESVNWKGDLFTKKSYFGFCQSQANGLTYYLFFDKDDHWLFIWMKMKEQQAVQGPGLLVLRLFGLTMMPGHQNEIKTMLFMNLRSLILNISWLTIYLMTKIWLNINKSVLDINILIIFWCCWGH